MTNLILGSEYLSSEMVVTPEALSSVQCQLSNAESAKVSGAVSLESSDAQRLRAEPTWPALAYVISEAQNWRVCVCPTPQIQILYSANLFLPDLFYFLFLRGVQQESCLSL